MKVVPDYEGGGAQDPDGHVELQDVDQSKVSRDLGSSPMKKIAGEGEALNEENADEFLALLDMKKKNFSDKENKIAGQGYKND